MNGLYDADFHAWTQQQAELLRAGQVQALDLDHLAEEIESMGASERRELGSRLDQELDALARQFEVPTFRVRQMLALTDQPSTSSVYWSKAAALHRQLHHRFFPLQQSKLVINSVPLGPWPQRRSSRDGNHTCAATP